MTADRSYSRRRILGGIGLGAGGLMLGGCDALNESEGFRSFLGLGEKINMGTQRLITGGALVREYSESEMSPVFRSNGSTMPEDPAYQRFAANGFSGWRLRVDGMVDRPLAISYDNLRSLPARTQITRHDCVEGWSAIGKWTGPQLSRILDMASVSPQANYIVFHCADTLRAGPYYESIDLLDAYHPQTILAWGMNDQPLPIAHGAPIRLRAERHLGYKQAKFIMRIEARARIDDLYAGNGGYWEDAAGYEWWAGI